MKKEQCDCDVNALLAEAKRTGHWSSCIRWDARHWWLRCPTHRVYMLIEATREDEKSCRAGMTGVRP